MTDDQSDIVKKMRERYLREWKHIHGKDERVKFCQDLSEMAAGVLAWQKFADGMSAYARKDQEDALSLFEEAMALDSAFACPWNGKGNVLNDQKRYDEALVAYEKAITLDPDYAYPWSNKADILRLQDRYDEALVALEKAIALDPEFAGARYNIGLLHWVQGRSRESADAFGHAIALGIESPWKEIAQLWIKRAERAAELEKAGTPKEEREQADRSSDEALVTDLFEAMKNDLPNIRKKKIEFTQRIRESVGRPRIVGKGEADNMLLVLRDWNSFSSILRRELRGHGRASPWTRFARSSEAISSSSTSVRNTE